MFKRLIRYLQRERHWVQVISYWKVGRRVGDIFRIRFGSLQGNRKSSSAGVTLLGSHTLKAYTRRQLSLQGAAQKQKYTQHRRERLNQKGLVLLCDLNQRWPSVRRPPNTFSTDKELVD